MSTNAIRAALSPVLRLLGCGLRARAAHRMANTSFTPGQRRDLPVAFLAPADTGSEGFSGDHRVPRRVSGLHHPPDPQVCGRGLRHAAELNTCSGERRYSSGSVKCRSSSTKPAPAPGTRPIHCSCASIPYRADTINRTRRTVEPKPGSGFFHGARRASKMGNAVRLNFTGRWSPLPAATAPRRFRHSNANPASPP